MDPKQLTEAMETAQLVKSILGPQRNEWLPVIAAVGGALVGGLVTIVPNYLIELSKRKNECRAVTSALLAEVRALLTIIEHRKYIESFRQITLQLESNPSSTYKISVKVPVHYSRVYQAHIDRLGLINPQQAAKIIEFHQLLDSVVQDIEPSGLIAEQGGNAEAFEQLIAISESAIRIGKELTE
jgi:hypothetical protein